MRKPDRPTPCDVPANSRIAAQLNGANFYDSYRMSLAPSALSAQQLLLLALSRTPWWVDALMALRNAVVRRLGLKSLGGLKLASASLGAAAMQVGDRIGIFTLYSNSQNEVIVGDDDKHLRVLVSLVRETEDSLVMTTVVHVHNRLGHLYMIPVKPMHKIIAPAVMRRLTISPPSTGLL